MSQTNGGLEPCALWGERQHGGLVGGSRVLAGQLGYSHRPTNRTASAFRWQHGRLARPSQITTTGQLRTTNIPRVADLGPGSPSSLQVGLVPWRPEGQPVFVCRQLPRLLAILGDPWPAEVSLHLCLHTHTTVFPRCLGLKSPSRFSYKDTSHWI